MSVAEGPSKRSLLRTTLLVMPALIVFRAGELLLPLMLAYWFGRTSATDVYYFSAAVFSFAGSLIFSAFRDSPLVPVLAEERRRHPESVPSLLGSVLMHTWVVGSALASVIGAAALSWFAVRYTGEDFALAAWMVAPFTVCLVMMATRTFFGALLTVERHFAVQAMASGLGTAINLGVLALGHARFGVVLVPVGALFGEVAALVLLAWFALRVVGLKLTLTRARPTALMRVARLIAYEVGGGAVTRINPVVDQLMASLSGFLGAGTILRNAGEVALAPTSLLQAALLPVLLSHLSEDVACGDFATFRRTVIRSLALVSALLTAATGVLWCFGRPILRFIFLHGEMDAAGVDRMIQLFPYHLVGLAPFGALLVLARAHVALKNSEIMIGMGVLNAGANVVLNLILLPLLGLDGLALSTSCVHTAIAVLFWFKLESRLRAASAPCPITGTERA